MTDAGEHSPSSIAAGAHLDSDAPFVERHIGPSADEQAKMLAVVGYGSVDELVAAAIPDSIQAFDTLNLPIASSEPQVLAELRGLAARNRRIASMIGLGYAETITPPVIRRNVLESPGWYTA